LHIVLKPRKYTKIFLCHKASTAKLSVLLIFSTSSADDSRLKKPERRSATAIIKNFGRQARSKKSKTKVARTCSLSVNEPPTFAPVSRKKQIAAVHFLKVICIFAR